MSEGVACWLCGRLEDDLGYEFVELNHPDYIGEHMCDDCVENNRDNEFGRLHKHEDMIPKSKRW